MRRIFDLVPDLLFVSGGVLLDIGLFQIAPIAGFIGAGVELIAAAVVLSLGGRSK